MKFLISLRVIVRFHIIIQVKMENCACKIATAILRVNVDRLTLTLAKH